MNYELNFNNIIMMKCGRKAANPQRAVGMIMCYYKKERKAKAM